MNKKKENNIPRGLRNNNPLNIRRTKTVWQGMSEQQTDRSFVQFSTPSYGYRAAWRTLFTYFYRFVSEHKPFCIATIIERWAPPTENDTQSYIRTVASLTGLGGNERLTTPLEPKDVGKLAAILAAMTVVENGIRPEEVNKGAIKLGYELAFHESYPQETEQPPQVGDEYWDWSPLAYGE